MLIKKAREVATMHIAISDIQNQLLHKPALVQEQSISDFQALLQKVYVNPTHFFILQIGDCAESFEDAREEVILKKCQFYTEMSHLLETHLQKEVILIGRIAGQYAKPRTAEFEEKDGCVLPSYRGDMINGFEFTAEARKPNPYRMLEAYEHANRTIKVIDTFCSEFYPKKIFTSHEALMLEYDSMLTRKSNHSSALFNASAHTVWLGDRTRHLSSAHMEYLSSIENPIGIKIGPSQSPETLLPILHKLNPKRMLGKITLITRLGAEMVQTYLPKLIEAVIKDNFPVLWFVDPMHGNTFKIEGDKKVRSVQDIIRECQYSVAVHQTMGTHLSGIHLEATYLPVTECVTVEKSAAHSCVLDNYTSKCDPRLNFEQTKIVLDALSIVQTQPAIFPSRENGAYL